MAEALVERDDQLAALTGAAAAAAAGEPGVVLVSGEAGIGKTSLVRAFTAALDPGAWRVLAAGCDDLLTPRPLGPFRDLAADLPAVAEALAGGSREALLEAVRDELAGRDRRTALVVEDVHWADDATIDVLRWLARRLDRVRGLVVLTFRPDDAGPDHPLRRLLGDLGRLPATRPVVRVEVPHLTADGVAALGAGDAAAAVLASTGGNPFFVTEVLATGEDGVPETVVDAVRARLAALGPEDREALEQLAVVPGHVPLDLAGDLLAGRGGLGALAAAE